MMMRHVADLKPGDAVRPFGDDRLWQVMSVQPQGAEHDPRVTVTFGHPVDGEAEVLACLSDLVTIACPSLSSCASCCASTTVSI